MKKNAGGFVGSRVLAAILAGCLVLGSGFTVFADEQNHTDTETVVADGDLTPTEETSVPDTSDPVEVTLPSEEETATEAGGAEADTPNESQDTDLTLEGTDPMPGEPVIIDEKVIDAFFEECLKIASPEIAAMDEAQLVMLEKAWMNNIFVYDPGDDILNAYQIDRTSDYARLTIALTNVRNCIDFVEANYRGNEQFLADFHEVVQSAYVAIVELGTYDLADRTVVNQLFDIVYTCYLGVREVEYAEIECYGESYLMEMFDAYSGARGAQDLNALLGFAAEHASAGETHTPDASPLCGEEARLPDEEKNLTDDEQEPQASDGDENGVIHE